jgi:hypothetical protein
MTTTMTTKIRKQNKGIAIKLFVQTIAKPISTMTMLMTMTSTTTKTRQGHCIKLLIAVCIDNANNDHDANNNKQKINKLLLRKQMHSLKYFNCSHRITCLHNN